MSTETGLQRAIRAVRHRLVDLDWTQAELARTSGVDPNTVSDFMTGSRRPSEATRARLSAALGWEPDRIHQLITGTYPDKTPPSGSASNTSSPSAPTESQHVVVDWSTSGPNEEPVVLAFPPGALDGRTEAERAEIIAAATAAALQRIREIEQGR